MQGCKVQLELDLVALCDNHLSHLGYPRGSIVLIKKDSTASVGDLVAIKATRGSVVGREMIDADRPIEASEVIGVIAGVFR